MNILIIDDDPVCQKLIQTMLEKYGSCSIAASGQEAIEAFGSALANGKPYDLMTLDIVMPEMNGGEALEAIRKLEKEHGIQNSSDAAKVIIITTMDDPDNCLEALEGGCEAIVKPFTKEELIEKVESCCGIAGKRQ